LSGICSKLSNEYKLGNNGNLRIVAAEIMTIKYNYKAALEIAHKYLIL
jgi:hypothetical protein